MFNFTHPINLIGTGCFLAYFPQLGIHRLPGVLLAVTSGCCGVPRGRELPGGLRPVPSTSLSTSTRGTEPHSQLAPFQAWQSTKMKGFMQMWVVIIASDSGNNSTCVSQHKSEIFPSKTLQTPLLFPPLLLPHFIQFIKSMEGAISSDIIFLGCY